MKKYILFAFNSYDARGGMYDIADSYETLECAIWDAQNEDQHDSHQIVDRDTWEVVWKDC